MTNSMRVNADGFQTFLGTLDHLYFLDDSAARVANPQLDQLQVDAEVVVAGRLVLIAVPELDIDHLDVRRKAIPRD